jgi:transcriptional regulator with GAF, ATPase, and Fis domain
MQKMLPELDPDVRLHAADIENLHRSIVALANERTGTRDGAIFLWDTKQKGLAVDFHVVEGVVVTIPDIILRKRRDGRANGIALESYDRAAPYRCNDTAKDPNYARYFLDVASVLAVPIPWQGRPIGVLTVSSKKRDAFTDTDERELEKIAQASAKYLRRAQLARQTREDTGRPYFIKGLSPEWLEVERRIEQVSAADVSVLVHGESGTGKDLVSRAIHFNSKRAQKPYVAVNCAAIPESMLESVLFGHVRGAFTGATSDKVGEFQKANGGTLFLDELGELPLMLQAKVLRAIEQGEVTPLGSNKAPERVDVRLVSATNRDLPKMVRDGKFRDDLYFRVGVISIDLPPLRSYKDNLEILAHVLLQQAAQKHGKRTSSMSRDAMALLQSYDFPGNVRELKNALEHAVIMARGEEVTLADLPRSIRESRPAPKSRTKRRTLAEMREEWLAPHERKYLVDLLSEHDGHVREAAAAAGINYVTMYRLMKKHDLTVKRSVS